jgi:8-oxo-dGTP pyrophosphatase MutT (NUDIX family)
MKKNSNNDKEKKKIIYCCNCGSIGHLYKNCSDPITSYGIILLKLDTNNGNNIIKKLLKNENIELDNSVQDDGVNIENESDLSVFYTLKDNIKFLLIRRKHTLGYIEFIRGRYKIDNIDGIIYLFQQMTKDEIKNINKKKFSELWNDLWSNNNSINNYENEYIQSKNKFMKLKNNETFLDFSFYINNVHPMWEHPEWCFPKGRRNYMENNIECACREFKEETCIKKDSFEIIDNFKPLEENLTGTNGIKYRHIYYFSIANENIPVSIDKDNKQQSSEIGDIGWFTYEEIIDLFRPHHTDRRSITTKIYLLLINLLIKNNKIKTKKKNKKNNVKFKI